MPMPLKCFSYLIQENCGPLHANLQRWRMLFVRCPQYTSASSLARSLTLTWHNGVSVSSAVPLTRLLLSSFPTHCPVSTRSFPSCLLNSKPYQPLGARPCRVNWTSTPTVDRGVGPLCLLSVLLFLLRSCTLTFSSVALSGSIGRLRVAVAAAQSLRRLAYRSPVSALLQPLLHGPGVLAYQCDPWL